MSLKKKSNMYFSLAQMVAAGMPIVRATRTAGMGGRDRYGRAMVRVSEEIDKNGVAIADAMRKRPNIFSPMDIMVVEVADNSGNLPEGCRMLANWYDLMGRIRTMIRTGLIFPLVILNIAAVVFPAPRLVMERVNTNHWDFASYLQTVLTVLAIFYIPIFTVAFLLGLSGTRGLFRRIVDHIAFHIPFLGGGLQAMALSRYCMAFGMMARAGVSVITTAQRAAELCGNAVIEERLIGGATAAKQGNPVVDGFSKWLPYEFLEMWRVGEETGDMGSMTARLAQTYEEQMVWRFTSLARAIPWIVYALVCVMILYMIYTLVGQYLGMLTNIADFG